MFLWMQEMKVCGDFYQESTLNCSFVKAAWVPEYVYIFQLILKMGKGLLMSFLLEIASQIKYDPGTLLKQRTITKMKFYKVGNWRD